MWIYYGSQLNRLASIGSDFPIRYWLPLLTFGGFHDPPSGPYLRWHYQNNWQMEVGRLPDLFSGKSGYFQKISLQGDVGGAQIHAPGTNAGSGFILHSFITLLIQPVFTEYHPGTTTLQPHLCIKNLILYVTSLLSYMFHINLPPTHPHCPRHHGFLECLILCHVGSIFGGQQDIS